MFPAASSVKSFQVYYYFPFKHPRPRTPGPPVETQCHWKQVTSHPGLVARSGPVDSSSRLPGARATPPGPGPACQARLSLKLFAVRVPMEPGPRPRAAAAAAAAWAASEPEGRCHESAVQAGSDSEPGPAGADSESNIWNPAPG